MDTYELLYHYRNVVVNGVLTGEAIPWIVAVCIGGIASTATYFGVHQFITTGHRNGTVWDSETKLRAKVEERMRIHELSIVEDAITNGIEDMVAEGKLSRRRARHWYAKMRQALGLEGLTATQRTFKKLHKFRADMLKERIKKSLANPLNRVKAPLPDANKGDNKIIHRDAKTVIVQPVKRPKLSVVRLSA